MKIKIGIPRALSYYRYGMFWQTFFEELGMEVVTSPNTTKKIIEDGKMIMNDECCLSLKIYMGHIKYLSDKVDYILVPRIDKYAFNEQTCTNFLALYDLVKNLFPNNKIINYNIDHTKGEDLKKAFISIGENFNIDKDTVLKAIKKAEEKKLEIDLKNWYHSNHILNDTGIKY